MSTQTVFRAGNSNVVAIPQELSKKLQLTVGQKVILEDNGKNEIVIKKVTKSKLSGKKEFERWWKAFLEENAEILDELAIR